MSTECVMIITLHADPTMPPGVFGAGGTHAYVRELACGLALQRRRAVIVTRRDHKSMNAHVPVNSILDLYRLSIGPDGPMSKHLLSDYYDESVEKILDVVAHLDSPPSLLHSVYWHSGRAAMEVSSHLKIPFVHTVISNSARRSAQGATSSVDPTFRQEVEKRVYMKAFRIFAVSADERDDLIKFYDVPSEKILIVGRPVDTTFLNPPHDELGIPRPVAFRTPPR